MPINFLKLKRNLAGEKLIGFADIASKEHESANLKCTMSKRGVDKGSVRRAKSGSSKRGVPEKLPIR
jgi:hypothetical protein